MSKLFLFSVLFSVLTLSSLNAMEAPDDRESQARLHASEKAILDQKEKDSQDRASGVSLVAEKLTHALYGGSQAHEIFQKTIRDAIPELANLIQSYREKPQLEDLKRIIQHAVDVRRNIAYEAGTDRPEDFGCFRKDIDDEYAVTGTHEPRYALLRSELQRRIRELLKSKDQVQKRSSRVIQLHQISLGDFRKFFKQELSPRASVEDKLNREYAHEFHEMPIEVRSYDPLTYIDYKDAISNLLLNKVGKGGYEERQILPTHTQISPSCFPQAPKFYQVDIIPDHQDKVRSYGFFAMIPEKAKNTGDFPIIIYHTENRNLSKFEDLYLQAFQEAITTISSDSMKVKEWVGRFCYRWTRVMPLVRGSASVMEDLLMPALFHFHGYAAENQRKGRVTIDHMGYMYWTEEEFIGNYKKAIELKLLQN